MKYLQDTEGNTITVPDDVFLFKRTVSFIDWAIRGEFSTTFSVPNDSETRKALGYYSVNQINRPTTKVFRFMFDGMSVGTGKVFIQSAGTTFDLFFVAGNSNWINQITGSIRDLDLSEFDIDEITAPAVIARMNATEGIIFPVIDWCYNFKKLTNAFAVKPISGVSVDSFYDLFPCFYQHTILERIFKAYNLKLNGNLTDNPTYKDLVVTPDEIKSAAYEAQISTVELQRMTGTDNDTSSPPFSSRVISMQSGTSYFVDATDSLDFPVAFTQLTFTFTITRHAPIQSAAPLGGPILGQLRKNGSTISSFNFAADEVERSQSIVIAVEAGDEFQVYSNAANCTGLLVVTQSSTISSGAVVSSILPDVSQFDFVKHIAQRFNCLVDFDDRTQEVTFTLLDSLRREDAVNLSNNLIDFQHGPSGYALRNFIRTQEAGELSGYKTDDLNYGDHLVSSDGEGDRDVIKTLFAPAESFINPKLEWLLTNVPLVRLEDADTGVDFTDVTEQFPSGSGVVGNFINSLSEFTFLVDEIVRIEGSVYSGFAMVKEQDVSSIKVYGAIEYTSNDTGKIYKQKIVFNNIGARELLVIRNTPVNNFNTGSPIYGDQNLIIVDKDGEYPVASAAWAFYAKPGINTSLDYYRIGLNYGPVTNTANIPFGDLFHKTLRKIIQAPGTKVRFYFSQSEYENLSMDNYIYIRVKDFEGYFLISDIQGFKNQFTPVEATIILID